jgi:AcrR family transcriptional regulator
MAVSNKDTQAVPTDPAVLAERRNRRRARVVKRLLTAVEQLLEEEESYLDISVEQILERGEIARSTFYSYFEDKADLVTALG